MKAVRVHLINERLIEPHCVIWIGKRKYEVIKVERAWRDGADEISSIQIDTPFYISEDEPMIMFVRPGMYISADDYCTGTNLSMSRNGCEQFLRGSESAEEVFEYLSMSYTLEPGAHEALLLMYAMDELLLKACQVYMED